MNYYIETYGCQMNLADSETISGIFKSKGLKRIEKPEKADFIIVNTCVVRESAVNRVTAQISRFKALKNKNKNLKLIVTGCLAQNKKEGLLKLIPFVDYVIGPDHYSCFNDIIKNHTAKKIFVSQLKRDFYGETEPDRDINDVNAWIPIMRGCNNFCSYCIVPYVRGREQSKNWINVVDEIKSAVDKGFKQVTLLGQNVNSYYSDDIDFPKLIRKIDKINGLERLRFMTSHPKDLSDELINCFNDVESLCEYLHLPLQSGSDEMLEKMNRGYTAKGYMKIIEKLKFRVPNIALSTDIISGFPGETEDDHKQTIKMLKNIEYDSAFMFIYSNRSGTKASKYKETLSHEQKVRRLNEIIDLQMNITKRKNFAYVGRVEDVLVAGLSPKDERYLSSRTRTFKNVIFKGNKDLISKLLKIKITGSTGWALLGERSI